MRNDGFIFLEIKGTTTIHKVKFPGFGSFPSLIACIVVN